MPATFLFGENGLINQYTKNRKQTNIFNYSFKFPFKLNFKLFTLIKKLR